MRRPYLSICQLYCTSHWSAVKYTAERIIKSNIGRQMFKLLNDVAWSRFALLARYSPDWRCDFEQRNETLWWFQMLVMPPSSRHISLVFLQYSTLNLSWKNFIIWVWKWCRSMVLNLFLWYTLGVDKLNQSQNGGIWVCSRKTRKFVKFHFASEKDIQALAIMRTQMAEFRTAAGLWWIESVFDMLF